MEENKNSNEEKILEKYLPIGTIVRLKGGEKRIMITGFGMAVTEEPNTIWDYCGCLYPEGVLVAGQFGVFNHDQIEEVFYYGLAEDEEEKMFKNALIEYMNKRKNS